MKQEYLGSLTVDTLRYGVSAAVSKSVWIILLPILARIFRPAEYALIDIAVIYFTFLSTLLTFGLDSSLIRYYNKTDDAEARKSLIGTILLFQAVIASISCTVILIFSYEVCFLIFNAEKGTELIKIVTVTVPLFVLYNSCLTVFRCRFESIRFLVVSIGSAAAQIAFTLYLVTYCRSGSAGVFEAILYSQAIFAAIGLLWIRKSCSLSFSFGLLKDLLRFGIPILFASFSIMALFLMDRFFLMRFVPLSVLGAYSAGARIASGVNMIVMGFLLAWSPFALSLSRKKEARQIYSRVFTFYLVLGFTAAVALLLLGREILTLLAPLYEGAENVIGILAFSYILAGAYSILSIGVTLAERTIHLAWPTMIGVAINIICYLALIPPFGVLGAACAPLVANLFVIGIAFFVNQRYYPIRYEFPKLMKLASICVLLFIAYEELSPHLDTVVAFACKALMLLGYFFCLFKLNIVSKDDVINLAGNARNAV